VGETHCVLTFYGGEPLLCVEEIKRVMDNVKAAHFVIQINGVFLHCLGTEYVNRFHTILVSVDGDEALTDFTGEKAPSEKSSKKSSII